MLATSPLWFFIAGEGRTRGDAGQAGVGVVAGEEAAGGAVARLQTQLLIC